MALKPAHLCTGVHEKIKVVQTKPISVQAQTLAQRCCLAILKNSLVVKLNVNTLSLRATDTAHSK